MDAYLKQHDTFNQKYMGAIYPLNSTDKILSKQISKHDSEKYFGPKRYSTHWQDQYFQMQDKIKSGVYGVLDHNDKSKRWEQHPNYKFKFG